MDQGSKAGCTVSGAQEAIAQLRALRRWKPEKNYKPLKWDVLLVRDTGQAMHDACY
jgi:hypothetical protein